MIKKEASLDTPEEADVHKTSPVFWAPAERFFVFSVDFPEGQEVGDLSEFAEIALEGESPFPIDQLYWGFYHEKGTASLLIYALYREGLAADIVDSIGEVLHAYPAFFPALLGGQAHDKVQFFKSGNSLSAIIRKGGKICDVESVDLTGFDVEGGRTALIASLNLKESEVEAGYWDFEGVVVFSNGSVQFSNRYVEEEGSFGKLELETLRASDRRLWSGDIRENDFLEGKRKELRVGKILWKTLIAASALMLACLIAEGGLFVGQRIVTSRMQTVDEIASHVADIEERDALVNKIEELSSDYYTPFEMLELLNENRPKEVYFTSVELGATNDLSLQGAADSVDQVNDYAEKLTATEMFENLELSEITSRRGKISFKMSLLFKVRAGGARG